MEMSYRDISKTHNSKRDALISPITQGESFTGQAKNMKVHLISPKEPQLLLI